MTENPLFSPRSRNPRPIPSVRQFNTLLPGPDWQPLTGMNPFPGADQSGAMWRRTTLGQRCRCFSGAATEKSSDARGLHPTPLCGNPCYYRKQQCVEHRIGAESTALATEYNQQFPITDAPQAPAGNHGPDSHISGIIKQFLVFTGFPPRGLDVVQNAWSLGVLWMEFEVNACTSGISQALIRT